MRQRDSLGRGIRSAFILFGVLLSLLFAMLAAVTVEGIEVYMVDQRLADVAEWALPRHAAGQETSLPAGVRFHIGADIPTRLRDLAPGVSDVDLDGRVLQVLSGSSAQGPYVVVDYESDYESIELVVYSMFAALFVACALLAASLGGFVGRRIVTPMGELAVAVSEGATALPLTGRKDELGILARALDTYTSQLRAFLDRERFFTGDVSHELRTPLTVILGAAEILAEHPDPTARGPAARIHRAALEATECMSVLLLLARAPEVTQLSPVSVSAVARRETERHQILLADKPVLLRCVGESEVMVRAPLELCTSAIGNLVRNACQYTESGTVTVRLAPGRVIVEDTGPGLPESVRQVLGHGVRAAPSSGSSGTGLGLSLVTRICEYLGATLSHEDCPQGGSRFTIVFPQSGKR